MIWKLLPVFMLCGMLSASELPEGWKPYLSVTKNSNAAPGKVELQDNWIRITDPGDKVENGIVKTFPCTPGDYVRVTVEVKPAGTVPMKDMEISAYFFPAQKERAGSIRISKPGKTVLLTRVAPEGIKRIQIFVYSYRPLANDNLVSVPKVEFSKTPFAAK